MFLARERVDVEKTEVDGDVVMFDQRVSRPGQAGELAVINSPAGFPVRTTSGGPEGF